MNFSPQRSTQSTGIADDSLSKSMRMGSYTIMKDKKLGSGSYSKVFLCQDKNKKKAAVKIMSKNGKKSLEIIKVAKMQIRILKKIDHPFISKFLGSYESENNFYILFAYQEGKTLRDILRLNYRLATADLLNIISTLLSALMYLHDKKIMHRDLKPDNIFFHARKATLIDFGFAVQLPNGEKQLLKDWVGTPSYMSPEVLERRKYSWKSDIWSFGILIYELVYGKLPWKGYTELELLESLESEQLKFNENISVPVEIKKMIKECLQRDVDRRISWKGLFEYRKLRVLKRGIEFENEESSNFCICSLIC